jgi:hypothetical protein
LIGFAIDWDICAATLSISPVQVHERPPRADYQELLRVFPAPQRFTGNVAFLLRSEHALLTENCLNVLGVIRRQTPFDQNVNCHVGLLNSA